MLEGSLRESRCVLGASLVLMHRGSMRRCGFRRRVCAITRAAGAVAAIMRLEVLAGAPRAAVPVVAGRLKAGRHARVVGRSSRREPRPQQQNMYNGAGSEMSHGGEYVQLTWLVSG